MEGVKKKGDSPVVLAIKIAVTAGLLGYLIWTQYKNWEQTKEILSGFLNFSERRTSFIIALILFFLSNITGFLVWWNAFLAMGHKLRPLNVFRTFFLGMFYNNLLPTSIGGDVVKVVELKNETVKTSTIVASVLIDRVVSAYVMAATALVFSTLLIKDIPLVILIALYAFAGITSVIGAVLIYHDKTYSALVDIVKKIIPWKKVSDFIVNMLEAFHMLKTKRRYALLMVGFIVLTQFLRIINVYFVSSALGNDTIPAYYFFAFIPIIGFAIMLPLSIGGIGIREIVGTFLFSRVPGLTETFSLNLMIASFIVSLVGNAICGIAFFIPKPKAPLSTEENES